MTSTVTYFLNKLESKNGTNKWEHKEYMTLFNGRLHWKKMHMAT